MAKMIPQFGAAETDSQSEPLIYELLQEGLSDDFTVIHSLPWLSAAASELDGAFVAPTGEVDFLILHPVLGVLAIEVKGGKYKIEGAAFVRIRSGDRVDAVRQTRNNVHGLARWLAGKNKIRFRIGYSLCFPDSHFDPTQLPPSLVDSSGPKLQAITLTFEDMSRLPKRICDVMTYWKEALKTQVLGPSKVKEIVNALCPNFDGTPAWAQRVAFDSHFWLRLTDEQSTVVNNLLTVPRAILTGWPGTGKTLIGIEVARRLQKSGARVLIVTYNSMLADYLSEQLTDRNCDVFTWHKLCHQARTWVGKSVFGSEDDWFQNECAEDLRAAIEAGRFASYDALILDEAQALRPAWCEQLVTLFSGKRIFALCDETQVFSFEKEPTTLARLTAILGGVKPFHLTIVMRMPRAVTDRLLEVQPSDLQLSSPRKFDADTVKELVVDDLETCLQVITDDLFAQGVEEHDIVILCKFSYVPVEVGALVDVHPGIKIRTVSRFRGMEASVIIIVEADEFSDPELFCAYSRATTVCLALFSASRLLGSNTGAFLSGVVSTVANREIIETLRHRSNTRTILAPHLKEPIDGVKSIELFWSRQWMCWMVQCVRQSPLSLWVDFLALNFSWPVLFWYEDSHNTVYLAQKNECDTYLSYTPLELSQCEACGRLTPSHSNQKSCYVCDGRLGSDADTLKMKHVRQLVEHDELLRSLMHSSAEEILESIKALPIVLSVAALAQYAAARHSRAQNVQAPDQTSGGDLYRWAVAVVEALIRLRSEGSVLALAEVALLTYHTDLPNMGIDQAKWHRTLASAFNLHYKNGLLSRTGKGRYVVTI